MTPDAVRDERTIIYYKVWTGTAPVSTVGYVRGDALREVAEQRLSALERVEVLEAAMREAREHLRSAPWHDVSVCAADRLLHSALEGRGGEHDAG